LKISLIFLDIGLDKWPLWAVLSLSFGIGLIAALITRFFVVERLKNYILGLFGILLNFAQKFF